MDFRDEIPYPTDYTLRGIGEHIQVWVTGERGFPDGDCRNGLGDTEITDGQIASFVSEFDANIYPKESQAFSVPPSRTGADAELPGMLNLPADYYQVAVDQADDIVVLVDNVRDANYYEPLSPEGQTFVKGFFSSDINELTDRNVMTIDAYDWLHRTGASPPDDSADLAYAACSTSQNRSGDRRYGLPHPRDYEGIFAHEYQHLLEYYADPDELHWLNEGLADYAQTLVGYVDTAVPPDQPEADGHIKCFAGFLGETFGGPENSLTGWEDQGAPEIPCDYGAAYTFMMYLFDRYGGGFLTALHREDANGLAGVDAVLDRYRSRKSAQDTMHDWAATVALDQAIDRRRGILLGGRKRDFTSRSLGGVINWDSRQGYDTPGAPPNGSDYVRLRSAGGDYLTVRQLRSISFRGSSTLPPQPVEWTVDPAPPEDVADQTTCGSVADGQGVPALHSGCGPSLDRSLVRAVTVPAAGGELTFETLFDTEEGWDFAFVQVSTDGGATWASLATPNTTSVTDPEAIPTVRANVPGFTGSSGTWRRQTADLSAYAGRHILIGFRYVTDPVGDEAGFWVRDINAAGVSLPSGSLQGWQTMTQARPEPVGGYTVQLIAYDRHGHGLLHRIRLDRHFTAQLGRSVAMAALSRGRDDGDSSVVAALIMQDDPSETVEQYARYELSVNGVPQPGG